MKKKVSWIILLTILSCSNLTGKIGQSETGTTVVNVDTAYVWTKVLDSADWEKSYNFQMFNIKDTLWVFHSDGNWYSENGTEWTKSSLSNSIFNLAFLDYVQFEEAIYGLGNFQGNIERFNFRPEIYKTSDLRKWDTISRKSNLPLRFFYHPFVFDNKIWIIGGEDINTQYADIWNSIDGVNWVKQKDNLPFGKRSGSQVVFFKGRLYMLGADVWSSTDGLNWQKESDEIVEGDNQFGGTAVVYDNKIWLLACNRNGQFQSKVFVSEDGKNWHGEDAPWTPRGAVAATVFKDKIYMTGGKYGGFMQDGVTTEFVYSNDLWTMGKQRK